MTQELECPLCGEEVFSDVGLGCKMCGMPLDYVGQEFCSIKCMNEFELI